MLTPVIQSSFKSIAAQLNTDNAELEFGKVKEYVVAEATPLFARIDMPKVLEEIAAEQAKKAPGDWSSDAREWGERNGLISGDTSGNKMYKKMLTREEFIAVLYRALHRNIID